jgi:multidrug efflux system membrane fusion protein
VWVVDPKSQQVRLVPVQLGSYREEGVALLGGITTDDWVVTAGVHLLAEGQRVRPIDRANRPLVL